MSYPTHPKSAQIRALAWQFKTIKEIVAETDCTKDQAHNQFATLKIRKAWITDEEKALLLAQRKREGKA